MKISGEIDFNGLGKQLVWKDVDNRGFKEINDMNASVSLTNSTRPGMTYYPGGIVQGRSVKPFLLKTNMVTQGEYRAHANVHIKAERPFVLLQTTPKSFETMIVARGRTANHVLSEVLGPEIADMATQTFPEDWDTREPLMIGAFTLFELRKDLFPDDISVSGTAPALKMSWWHAFEYCRGNGLFLPTDDQWVVARGEHQGGGAEIKIADARENTGGESWEWMDRNSSEANPFGMRTSCRRLQRSSDNVSTNYRVSNHPNVRYDSIGFRTALPA